MLQHDPYKLHRRKKYSVTLRKFDSDFVFRTSILLSDMDIRKVESSSLLKNGTETYKCVAIVDAKGGSVYENTREIKKCQL